MDEVEMDDEAEDKIVVLQESKSMSVGNFNRTTRAWCVGFGISWRDISILKHKPG